MKSVFMALLLLGCVFFIACENKKPAAPPIVSTNGSNSFMVDGKEYFGKIETQYFGNEKTGAYSVVCQQDDPLALLQITFADETDAASDKKLILTDNFMRMEKAEVYVSLSGTDVGSLEYISSESVGDITAKGRTVTLKNLKLKNRNGEVKTVNATLSF